MSTSSQPLKYLWSAYFEDGTIINQPADDRYSKHVEGAEWNPSSFRDLIDYQEKSPLTSFSIEDNRFFYAVYLPTGEFTATSDDGVEAPFTLEHEPVTDRKLIYYREMHKDNIDGEWQEPRVNAYIIGYEGKDANGKVHKKIGADGYKLPIYVIGEGSIQC